MRDNRRTRDPRPERVLTARDWKAFHLVFVLLGEISEHGAKALDTFIDAMIEIRSGPTT